MQVFDRLSIEGAVKIDSRVMSLISSYKHITCPLYAQV